MFLSDEIRSLEFGAETERERGERGRSREAEAEVGYREEGGNEEEAGGEGEGTRSVGRAERASGTKKREKPNRS